MTFYPDPLQAKDECRYPEQSGKQKTNVDGGMQKLNAKVEACSCSCSLAQIKLHRQNLYASGFVPVFKEPSGSVPGVML